MTSTQMMRYQRRAELAAKRERQRQQVIAALVAVVFTLLAFGLAGMLDYQDRTGGLGASMMPSAEWVAD